MHEPRQLDFIDALRGLAILLVVLFHASAAAPPATPVLQGLLAFGARGVQLFYIASAITLCLSWEFRSGRERAPLTNFYLRRWFRIAPMFYVAIAGYLILFGMGPRFWAPNGVEWSGVALTALFLNGFHPELVNAIVPGGWSIAVEMTFYLVLPFLATRFRSIAALTALVVASLVLDRATNYAFRRVYLPMYPPEQAYLVDNFPFISFFAQFPVFAIGMLAYGVHQRPTWRTPVIAGGTAAFIGWMLFWPMLTGATLFHMVTRHLVIGAGFAVLALALWQWPVRVLVNPVTRWIGKLSFSMYVTHFAVIEASVALGVARRFQGSDLGAAVHFAVVVVISAAVSWLCYRWIERPGIEAGRRLIERREARTVRAPSVA